MGDPQADYEICSNHVDSLNFSNHLIIFVLFVEFSSDEIFSETTASNQLKFYRDIVCEVV